jgi:O-antigen/teichoic acid export membrane protein
LYRTTVTPKPELEYRRIRRHYDPAIAIGNHYVVTGWGPEEEAAHADEKSEQRAASVREQESAHMRDWRNATIFGGVASAILGLLFVLYCQYNPQLMLPLCTLTAIGSISLLGFSQRIGALAEGDESWEPALLAIALSSSGIVGVYFITFGFVAGSTLYGLLGGLAFVIAVAMTTFRHHMLTSK